MYTDSFSMNSVWALVDRKLLVCPTDALVAADVESSRMLVSCSWIRGSAIRFYCNLQLWHSVHSARVCLLGSASFVLSCVFLFFLNDCSLSMNDPWSLASFFSRGVCVETDPIYVVPKNSLSRGVQDTGSSVSLRRMIGNL